MDDEDDFELPVGWAAPEDIVRNIRRKQREERELKALPRYGVQLLDVYHLRVRCLTCRTEWSPKRLPDGSLPANWWTCPTDPVHTQARSEGGND